MINTLDLHKLIKNLTKSEKRYFKDKTLKLNPDGTKYLELFDLLDSIKKYSNERFKKELVAIGIHKNVSYTQNYLFNVLLEELHNYRKQNDIELKIKDSIAQAKFLYERNLLSTYKKVLINAEKQAGKYEYFNLQLQILEELKALVTQIVDKKGISKQIDQLNNKIDTIKHKRDIYNQLRHTLTQLYDLRNQGFDIRNPIRAIELNQIIEEINGVKMQPDYGFRILFHYNVIRETIGDTVFEDSSQFGNNILNLYNTYKHFKDIDLIGYIKSLLNYLQTLLEFKRFVEADKCFKELEELLKHCVNKGLLFLATLIEEGTLVSKYYYTYQQGLIEETEENIYNLDQYLSRDDISEYKKIWYMNSIPFFFFHNNKYNEALEWTNKLLNIPVSQGVNVHHYIKLKILEIILHYELGNYLLLDNLVDTNEKYLRKYDYYHETEQILFKIFRSKHFRWGLEEKLNPIFVSAHTSLKELVESNKNEREQLKNINYLSWLESKV